MAKCWPASRMADTSLKSGLLHCVPKHGSWVVRMSVGGVELGWWGEDDTGRRTMLGRADVIYDEEAL
ncbi:hypothetical protein B0I32_101273 [Nonomuraea fuscirosea]|uniref:Uncharacterized protein n=1 Tax=Nonomuraea fuscirosea TaxID=1291556 RepID=A0A2T0NBD8_9ACTN|nr:hypothetical protein B0I32_101273 [Nonomuraea fuscirosea]